MRRLRAEHAALVTLSRILLELVAAPAPPRATELIAARGLLRDTLVRHLKCEDWVLYPRLRASGDPDLVRMASDFVCEMGSIAQDFDAYDRKWTADRVAGDWAGFGEETRAVLAVLGTRIERENRDLYPLAERLDRI